MNDDIEEIVRLGDKLEADMARVDNMIAKGSDELKQAMDHYFFELRRAVMEIRSIKEAIHD